MNYTPVMSITFQGHSFTPCVLRNAVYAPVLLLLTCSCVAGGEASPLPKAAAKHLLSRGVNLLTVNGQHVTSETAPTTKPEAINAVHFPVNRWPEWELPRDSDLLLLKHFPNAKFLTIAGKHITRDGLNNLDVSPQVRYLTIDVPGINDNTLAKLGTLKQVSCVTLDGGSYSAAAVDQLSSQLPTCKIVIRFPPFTRNHSSGIVGIVVEPRGEASGRRVITYGSDGRNAYEASISRILELRRK